MTTTTTTTIVEVQDLLDELCAENRRLVDQLEFGNKCWQLLARFRQTLSQMCDKCQCGGGGDTGVDAEKLAFNRLDNQFVGLSQEFDDEKHYRFETSMATMKNQKMKKTKKTQKTKTSSKLTVKFVDKTNEKFTTGCGRRRSRQVNRFSIDSQLVRNWTKKNSDNNNNNNCDINEENTTTSTDINNNNNHNVIINDSINESDLQISINGTVRSSDTSATVQTTMDAMLDKLIDCIGCDLKFPMKKRLMQHIRNSHHDIYDTRRSVFKCTVQDCLYESDRYRGLTEHNMKHRGCKPFKCVWPGCESSFYRNTHLIVHKASHEGLKPYVCDWPSCGQTFRSNSNLKHHHLIHTNERPYKCEWPGCEAQFRSASSRIRHKVVHRSTADYRCQWSGCGKSFKFKGSLKRHTYLHEMDDSGAGGGGCPPLLMRPSLSCKSMGCQITFLTKRQMSDHIRQNHTNNNNNIN